MKYWPYKNLRFRKNSSRINLLETFKKCPKTYGSTLRTHVGIGDAQLVSKIYHTPPTKIRTPQRWSSRGQGGISPLNVPPGGGGGKSTSASPMLLKYYPVTCLLRAFKLISSLELFYNLFTFYLCKYLECLWKIIIIMRKIPRNVPRNILTVLILPPGLGNFFFKNWWSWVEREKSKIKFSTTFLQTFTLILILLHRRIDNHKEHSSSTTI